MYYIGHKDWERHFWLEIITHIYINVVLLRKKSVTIPVARQNG